MTNTFITAGTSTFEELFEGIEKGLYAKKMGGGSVNPQTGEFNFAVNEGYLIENGKIVTALTETMISGCVPDMLQNVRAVSSEALRDGYCCLPFIAFDGVTVSGK